jgi:GT2 family glycosyltransferase
MMIQAVAENLECSTHAFDLDVGVIYSGERQWMGPLINSLGAAAGGLRLRLILVDNASTDGVDEWLSLVPTTVLRNDTRQRYGANLNRVLAAASAPYVLLMNTDMYFAAGEPCLAQMLRFMQEHPRCGVSICRLYRPDGVYGHPARRFQTLPIIAARRLGLAKWFRRALVDYLYQEQSRFESFECDWVSGCFLFVRKAAADEIGGFDLRFKKYFEDVDFCQRLAIAGWKVMFHGGTYCYHHEQRASRRLWSADAWSHARSYLEWLRKTA